MIFIMRNMRITLSIPDALGRRFLAAVPSRKRSATVARLLTRELALEEKRLEEACMAANRDVALSAEVREWQAFDDNLPERAKPRSRR
jgi:hypothetical protein